MTDRQFRLLITFAACYFLSQTAVWLGFGVYCWLTGRL